MTFLQTTLDKLKTHKFLIASIVTIFLVFGIVYYYKVVSPKLNPKYVDNREFLPKDQAEQGVNATLFFFYTDWCPLSKQARPEFDAFKENTEGAVEGVTLIFREINCDDDTATADKYKITGYPTIKLVYRDKIYEYDAKPDRATLLQFVREILKQN
tara:strand:- start:3612 stop:4079 length:468 start_codon:yes stop_codon:yes gene_type:complete